ncbi:hypothetical protein GCM10023226_03330 [Nocardioides nanhaiensis]|uniref:histidine kinase n=1 Tax=Nocardioides nanhaiensis TaxID=1476871 RepID=A0ABP8VRN8_9ACTN
MDRLLTAFGVHEGWQRPVPLRRTLRVDVVVALVFAGGALLSLETARSLGSLAQVELSQGWQYVWLLLPAATLVVRRVYPLTVLLVAITHLSLTAVVEPALSPAFAVQLYYFFALFSAIAWAPDRRRLVAAVGLFVAVCLGWIVLDFAIRDGLETLAAAPQLGWFTPAVAAVLQVGLSTLVFLMASCLSGTLTWWSACREAEARRQAVTIADQAAQLSDAAVGRERLRIARELHDVVGHHIAVIGIQTGAARRVLERSPEQASEAMLHVEESARAATRDLRLLLGALRTREETESRADTHPGGVSLPLTVEAFERLGLEVRLRVEGELDAVPTSVGLTLHRVLQESLTNVRRHSTAQRVDVEVVVHGSGTPEAGADGPRAGTVSLVVRDHGSARGDTSGSGIGIRGMRERVALHGGSLETSTTPDGGFRVAACLPWQTA